MKSSREYPFLGFIVYKYSIYVYTVCMKTVTYPDWAEKYRGKGRTIRKTRYGYGLYQCTSVYVRGQKYPKSVQKYLGMITEKDGFIPKKSDKLDSADLVEYGLSSLIFLNFKRDLQRSVFNGDKKLNRTRLAIVYYLYHSFQPRFLKLSRLTCCDSKLSEIALKVETGSIKMLSGKISVLLEMKIPDAEDRNYLLGYLRQVCVSRSGFQSPAAYYPNEITALLKKYGVRYE